MATQKYVLDSQVRYMAKWRLENWIDVYKSFDEAYQSVKEELNLKGLEIITR